MSTYLSLAIAYIQESGDEVERARLAGLLGRDRPEPKVVRTLGIRQNEDGGYPYGMIPGRPSAIVSTATGFQWMQDLRLSSAAFAARAVGYLLTVQRPEGAWEESPAVIKYEPPHHVRPGASVARTYCTGLATFWLARLAGPRHDAVVRAGNYLRAQRDGGWPANEPVPASALVTAALALIEGADAPVVTAGTNALSRLPAEMWTADWLAEMLTALHAARFTSDNPLVAWSLRQLQAAQRADGGWSSDQGADRDVDLSLRALGTLLAFGVSCP